MFESKIPTPPLLIIQIYWVKLLLNYACCPFLQTFQNRNICKNLFQFSDLVLSVLLFSHSNSNSNRYLERSNAGNFVSFSLDNLDMALLFNDFLIVFSFSTYSFSVILSPTEGILMFFGRLDYQGISILLKIYFYFCTFISCFFNCGTSW